MCDQIDKSHPIHVRHDAKNEKKDNDPQKPQKQKSVNENKPSKNSSAKKKPNSKATLYVVTSRRS